MNQGSARLADREAMKASKLSQNGLAQRMRTSRSQVRRLLDPTDGNVTLNTLQRAARIVGRSLRFETRVPTTSSAAMKISERVRHTTLHLASTNSPT